MVASACSVEHDVTRFQVEILAEAESEIRDAYQWYFARSPMAAGAFRDEVFSAIDALSSDATTWPEDEDQLHFRALDRFPYTIHYDLTDLVATVIAVAHQHRRPKYWRDRT